VAAELGLPRWWLNEQASSYVAPSGDPAALTLIKVPVYRACSITSILLEVATAGSGLTSGGNWAGLYTASGALIGRSGDQSSGWASTGLHTMALAGGPYYFSQGWAYVAILTNGTTQPAFGRATVQGSGAVNAGLTVSTARHAVNSSALTTLPSSITMSENAFSATAFWTALV
jgi:hypothetical protein